MRPGRCNGLFLAGLPGRNGHVGDLSSLPDDIADSEAINVTARPEIVYGKVDHFGNLFQPCVHHHMQYAGGFHKAADHAAMYCGSRRVAQVALVLWQFKNKVFANRNAVNTDELGIGYLAGQFDKILLFYGICHQGGHIRISLFWLG